MYILKLDYIFQQLAMTAWLNDVMLVGKKMLVKIAKIKVILCLRKKIQVKN